MTFVDCLVIPMQGLVFHSRIGLADKLFVRHGPASWLRMMMMAGAMAAAKGKRSKSKSASPKRHFDATFLET